MNEKSINSPHKNLSLLLADICLALFILGSLTEMIIMILSRTLSKYPEITQQYRHIVLILAVPIFLLIMMLIFCIFIPIVKSKVIFIFFITICIYFMYLGIIGLLQTFQLYGQFVQLYNMSSSHSTICLHAAIYFLVYSLSSLIISLGFVLGAIFSFARKKLTKLWSIPGVIILLGYIVKITSFIIHMLAEPIINFFSFVMNTQIDFKIITNYGYIFALIIGVIFSFFLVPGTFLLCKGCNK